jgi:protein pelota
MRFLERDDDKGIYRIRVDSIDDLWYLHQAVAPGQLVGGHTFRKLEAKEDQVRADSQPRIKVYLRIDVEDCEFHPFTDILRVSGRIVDGPQDISGHHTFNVDKGTVLDITLPEPSQEIMGILEEAGKVAESAPAIAVSLDDETAELFRMRDYGLESIGRIRAKGGGKWTGQAGGWGPYYEEISELVKQNISEDTIVLISGPGFFKESLAKLLRQEIGLEGSRLHLMQSSSGGVTGLREALGKGGSANKVVEKLRFVQENELLEDLMSRIGKGKGAAYGIEEVSKALEMGAVEVLLVSERIFREGPGKELMKRSSVMGSRCMVISTSHEMGDMLDKMGGVGALLRFEL